MKNVTVKNNVSGITLITLVVTVIVLMILAGITFSALFGEEGVLNLARNESDTAQKTLAKEKIRLEVAGSKKVNGKYDAENIRTNILSKIKNSQVSGNSFPLITTVDGYTFLIDNYGRVLDANFDYLVQFDGNGVEGIMNSQEFNQNETKKLFANKFNQDGHIFLSWNTKPDGSGTEYKDEALVSNLTSEKYGVIILYAQWANGTAEVNGTVYDTLQLAINAVPKNNVQTTVKLLTNTKENIEIKEKQNIILNLQNHTVSAPENVTITTATGNTTSTLSNEGGTVTIISGTIKSSSVKDATINNNSGKITIGNGAKILMEEVNGKQALYIRTGTVEITGTAYLSSVSAGSNIRATVQNLAGSNLTITGGTIISKSYHGVENAGTMTIGTKDGIIQRNSPIIQGSMYGIKCSTKFNFYDGTIKGKTCLVSDGTGVEKIDSYIEDKEPDVELIKSYEEPYNIAYLSGGVDLVIVTFDPNGGDVDETTRNVEMGKAVGGLPTPTRTQHEFIGWYTEANGGDMINEQTEVTSNVTYYAHWNSIFKVNFDANGGSVEETIRYINSGNAIGELPTPTRDNYYFIGWFTDSNGGVQINAETPINANDITYYAHWLPIFKVNFDANGGSVGETSRYVVSGNAIGELPTPTRDKYDFMGWFTTKTGGVQINAETPINANNNTYYAHWKKTMYAKIGDQEYETVAKAINAITDGTETTITLTKDTNENITIKSGQNIVLDIGDNTLNANTNAAVITNNGKLKIISGTVASTQNTGTINNNKNGTLVIDGGIITGKERSAVYNDGGTVIIQGDSYLESSAKGNAPDSSGMPLERATINNINGGKVTITGGTIVGINNAAVCNDASTLTVGVKDGSVSIASPVLIGNTYGIKNGAKSGKTYTFKLYDGIAGGITGGTNSGIVQQVNKTTISRPGTITEQEENTQIASGTKTINGKTYNTNYLVPIQ